MTLTTDVVNAIEDVISKFAQEIEAALFASHGAQQGPDGDLGRIPELIDRARALDLLADASQASGGHELGVWGHHVHTQGARVSLITLEGIGYTCAGFAATVHAQGLGALALADDHDLAPGTVLAAAWLPSYGFAAGNLAASAGLHTTADFLHGTAHFALAAGPPDQIVCFAQDSEGTDTHPEWTIATVPCDAAGTTLVSVDCRGGLRAAHQFDIVCERVDLRKCRAGPRGAAARTRYRRVLACDWLGQSAIALGAARRALDDARRYADERRQGGNLIREHASVHLLLADAEYDIAVLDSVLARHRDNALEDLSDAALLHWAATARLAVTEHAHRAVTNSLQTLGGYGYMDDYGFSKRLRDVAVLRSLHAPPDQLRLLLDDIASPATDTGVWAL